MVIFIDLSQLRSSDSLKTHARVNNLTLSAVVDTGTAAQVTVICDEVYGQLDPNPKTLKLVSMHRAG